MKVPSIETVKEHLKLADPHLKKSLKDFAKYPTERNYCYFVGYLAAREDTNTIEEAEYLFWLAFSGVLESDIDPDFKQKLLDCF